VNSVLPPESDRCHRGVMESSLAGIVLLRNANMVVVAFPRHGILDMFGMERIVIYMTVYLTFLGMSYPSSMGKSITCGPNAEL